MDQLQTTQREVVGQGSHYPLGLVIQHRLGAALVTCQHTVGHQARAELLELPGVDSATLKRFLQNLVKAHRRCTT